MPRLALAALVVGAVLFVAGIAQSTSSLVLGAAVCAAAMLVALVLADRAETQAIAAAAPSVQAAPSAPDAVASVEAVKVLAPEAKGSTKRSTSVTAVLDDVSVEELLGRVQGLGPRKVEALAAAFSTSAALRAATKDDLTAIQGIGPAIADRILAARR